MGYIYRLRMPLDIREKHEALARARGGERKKAQVLRDLIEEAYEGEVANRPIFGDAKWRCVWDPESIYKQPRNARPWNGADFELNLEVGVFPLGSIWESQDRLWAVCGDGLLWPNVHKLEIGEVDYPEEYPPQHLRPLNGRVREEVRWRIEEIR